jgi:hypothetical protein
MDNNAILDVPAGTRYHSGMKTRSFMAGFAVAVVLAVFTFWMIGGLGSRKTCKEDKHSYSKWRVGPPIHNNFPAQYRRCRRCGDSQFRPLSIGSD